MSKKAGDRSRFLASFPKSGTYFMRHILELDDAESRIIPLYLGGSKAPLGVRFFPNGISGHFACHPTMLDITHGMHRFFIMRDPRDVIVSWAHYAPKLEDHHVLARLYDVSPLFDSAKVVADIKGAEDPIMMLIKHLPDYIQNFLDWPEHAHTVRYEKLLSEPKKELATVADVLDEPLDKLVERSKFRGGTTFRKGVAGEWRHEFNTKHKEEFSRRWEEVMDKWEYSA